MLLWFAGGSALLVWSVFRDPWLDYRVLVVGALLPDAVDAVSGGTGAFHSILAPIVVLVAVMLATRGRRPARKRWLALPIGMFAHLLLDGVWTSAEVFWWPLVGDGSGGALPSVVRPAWIVAVLEVLGLAFGWLAFGFVQDARTPSADGGSG